MAGNPEITFITKEQADRVGNKVGENTEAIVALNPDLVLFLRLLQILW